MFFLPRLIIDSCPFHVFLPGVDAQPGSRTTATGALTSMSWQSERAAANPPVSFHSAQRAAVALDATRRHVWPFGAGGTAFVVFFLACVCVCVL